MVGWYWRKNLSTAIPLIAIDPYKPLGDTQQDCTLAYFVSAKDRNCSSPMAQLTKLPGHPFQMHTNPLSQSAWKTQPLCDAAFCLFFSFLNLRIHLIIVHLLMPARDIRMIYAAHVNLGLPYICNTTNCGPGLRLRCEC